MRKALHRQNTFLTFDPPLNVSFKALIKEGKFYTLDGEKEVKAPWYAKFINSINDLTAVEINYILIRYSNLNKALAEMARHIATTID